MQAAIWEGERGENGTITVPILKLVKRGKRLQDSPVISVAYGVQSEISRFLMYPLNCKAILPLQKMIYRYINVH